MEKTKNHIIRLPAGSQAIELLLELQEATGFSAEQAFQYALIKGIAAATDTRLADAIALARQTSVGQTSEQKFKPQKMAEEARLAAASLGFESEGDGDEGDD